MYDSSACWKSASEVNRGLRQLVTKRDKYVRWCQGKIVRVLENKKYPTVEVLWDPIEESNTGAHKTCVELRDRKWNPKTDTEGAWRLELIIED